MASYIRCPSCGFCIGKYTTFVDLAKQTILNDSIFNGKSEYKDYDPEKIMLNPNITPNLENLFNMIGIKNRCCRMHIISGAKFDKTYK